jgi:hypothetical protein
MMESRLRSLAWLIVIATVAFIVAGTLFPFRFTLRNRRSLVNSFGLSKDIAQRGNDLLIGVDGNIGQSFKGRIDDLRIYRRALSAAEIAQTAANIADVEHQPMPDPDLVLAYTFDEHSEDVVPDASGKQNHGRIVKAPEWVNAEHGGALRFNGSGQYIRVPNSDSIDIGGRHITIAMRVALEGPLQRFDQDILAKPWHAGSGRYPWFQYAIEFDSNGSQSVDFYLGDTSGRPRGPYFVRPPVGPWTHVAFTYDGDQVRGYVDGREELSSGLSPWQPGDVVRNVLLFLPLGFGVAALMRDRKYPIAAIVVGATVSAFSLSLAIEITQSLLPNRYSSFVDLATNTIGGAVGSIGYVLMELKFRR